MKYQSVYGAAAFTPYSPLSCYMVHVEFAHVLLYCQCDALKTIATDHIALMLQHARQLEGCTESKAPDEAGGVDTNSACLQCTHCCL